MVPRMRSARKSVPPTTPPAMAPSLTEVELETAAAAADCVVLEVVAAVVSVVVNGVLNTVESVGDVTDWLVSLDVVVTGGLLVGEGGESGGVVPEGLSAGEGADVEAGDVVLLCLLVLAIFDCRVEPSLTAKD